VGNETIPIKFSDDCFNYYVVGNCFNSKFILFFVTSHYPDFCKTETFLMKSYKLKIIDSNVEIKELDESHSIIITKDSYVILPYK
jgi:hypothetical protein